MPCLALNPSQTQERQKRHQHLEVKVMEATYVDTPTPSSSQEANADGISGEQVTTIGHRKLITPVDFDKINVTEEQLQSRLTAFDVVREAHSLATLKLR